MKKAFFIMFNRLSLKQIKPFLEGESPALRKTTHQLWCNNTFSQRNKATKSARSEFGQNLKKKGGVKKTLPAMGAVHVRKSVLDMLKSQMWRNSQFKDLLLADAYCLYDFLFKFGTSPKNMKLFVIFYYCFCLFVCQIFMVCKANA